MNGLGRCGGCEYFVPNLDPKFPKVEGFCHANPPQLIVYPAGGNVVVEAKFPPVPRGEWCGAFNPADEMQS